jgi:hypothetical protein
MKEKNIKKSIENIDKLLAVLKPKERVKYLRNLIKYMSIEGIKAIKSIENSTPSNILSSTFVFEDTPEGHTYWSKIVYRLRLSERT